jgi:MFS family permease
MHLHITRRYGPAIEGGLRMTNAPVRVAGRSFNARAWALLLLLCGVIFLDGMDVSMVGVALPSIQHDLDLSTSTLQWVVSGYVLGYGGFLLLGGRAADLFGRRRVLLIALAVFVIASLAGGFVSEGWLLIAARFVKGLSAAFTAPASLSIITTTFAEGPARNRALSIYTATGASGFSLGLVFGGLLTEVGWRYTFLLPAPVALGLLVAGFWLIPRAEALRPARRGLDLPGAASITAAMLLLVYTVVEAPDVGWAAPRTILSFAGVAALLAALVAIERRSAHPLIRLGILRSGALVRANLGAMALFGSWVGFQFVGTLYMQDLRGWSALEMALAFLPAGVVVALGAPRAGGIVDRIGTRPMIAVGLASAAAGYLLFLRVGLDSGYAAMILPTMLLCGLGFASAFGPLNIAATNGIAAHEQGLASGLLNTSFQLGGALVLAVVTAVARAGTEASSAAAGSSQALLDGFRPAVVVSAVAALLGVVATLAARRARATAPALDTMSAGPEYAQVEERVGV